MELASLREWIPRLSGTPLKVAIVAAIVEVDGQFRVTPEIMADFDLSKSTAHRGVEDLVDLGFLVRVSRGLYRITCSPTPSAASPKSGTTQNEVSPKSGTTVDVSPSAADLVPDLGPGDRGGGRYILKEDITTKKAPELSPTPIGASEEPPARALLVDQADTPSQLKGFLFDVGSPPAPPDPLLELDDWVHWWNALVEANVVAHRVKNSRGSEVVAAWNKAKRVDELCEILTTDNRQKLRDRLAECAARESGWWTFPKFLASQMADRSCYKLTNLFNGGYAYVGTIGRRSDVRDVSSRPGTGAATRSRFTRSATSED